MLEFLTHLFLVDALATDRARLAFENVMLRQELAVPQRSVKRPRIYDEGRAFWTFMLAVLKEGSSALGSPDVRLGRPRDCPGRIRDGG